MRIISLLLIPLLLACTPVDTFSPNDCPACNCPVQTAPVSDELVITFLDVGQGDAEFIQSGTTEMLIDCGRNSRGMQIADFLRDNGVTELDYLIITHPDADHLGGCDDVLREVRTKMLIMNGEERDTHSYNDVMDEANNQKQFGLQIITGRPGSKYNIGPAVAEILQANNGEEDSNQNSIVTRLTYNTVSALFTGDCDKGCEELLMDKNIEADILKVAHHGTKFATTLPFLNLVRPELAVISVGDNSYGHPAQETLDRLDQEGVQVRRTDMLGDIVVEVNWNSWEVK